MIKPELLAYFVLDTNGKPKTYKDGGMKHYEIKLSTINTPDDTYAVTYVLDDSYQDPYLESKNSKNDYEEWITSFGDYSVVAKVRTKSKTIVLNEPLFKALKKGHEYNMTPEIEKALNDIRAN